MKLARPNLRPPASISKCSIIDSSGCGRPRSSAFHVCEGGRITVKLESNFHIKTTKQLHQTKNNNNTNKL
jgi:hypothetical protein